MRCAASQPCQRCRNGTKTHKQGWRFSFRRAKVASPSRPQGLLRQRVRDAGVLRGEAYEGVCPTFYTWRFFPGCTTHEANCAS